MLSARKYSLLIFAAILAGICSCSNIECPLGNLVQVKCGIYDMEGNVLRINDSLTVRACGTEATLLNRSTGLTSFSVPLAYKAGIDTLLLQFTDENHRIGVDSVFVRHESSPHFESVDCPVVFFHNVNQVNAAYDRKSTFPYVIDHVDLSKPIVNYDSDENVRIYLRSVSD